MIVLVLNAGSSSLKFKLLQMPQELELGRGQVERIGEPGRPADARFQGDGNDPVLASVPCPDHRAALQWLLDAVTDPDGGCLAGTGEIEAVGHRVVHGRALFTRPTQVDDGVLDRLEELVELAPLHMPANLACIRRARELLPGLPHVALFDTAFHASMPRSSHRYGVPPAWYAEHGVRRYGFHGISHEFLARTAAGIIGVPFERARLVTAHLGNGASVTAVDRGRVLDTSMGFTPLEGLMMGTRAGSFDPAVIPYLVERTGRSARSLVDEANTGAGLAGIGGVGRDMRDVLQARAGSDPNAELAFEMYVHTLRKTLGALLFALGGADAVVFSGGVGENVPQVRAAALPDGGFGGIRVDPDRNLREIAGEALDIGHRDSAARVLVIPADEERLIARRVFEAVGGVRG